MSLEEVHKKIRRAEKKAGRSAGSVSLVAVSKVQPEERVRLVLEEGHRVFGENRVQEAQQRWSVLKPDYPDVSLHLIGPLQTNKVKAALALFDVIESVDRTSLARKLASEIANSDRPAPKLFVQINTGDESQKAGISPSAADAFIQECLNEHGLLISGVMAIPPASESCAPHFALLANIAARNDLKEISMGMSGDFETAIEFGATEVRVGSAVFGERVKPSE